MAEAANAVKEFYYDRLGNDKNAVWDNLLDALAALEADDDK